MRVLITGAGGQLATAMVDGFSPIAEVRALSRAALDITDPAAVEQQVITFKPDAIITSPKLRAAQTAEIVADHLGVAVTEDDRLAGSLDLKSVEAVLAAADGPERPVLVGHDPDFSELLAELCDAANHPMRKGTFAQIECDRPLRAGGGTLRWLIPPDALRSKR